MPRKSSNSTGKTCGCIVLAIVAGFVVLAVIGAIVDGNNSKTTPSTSSAQFTGSDPHAFETALDLYTEPVKPALSDSDYAAYMGQVNYFVSMGTYPEEMEFRSVLAKLDGAHDLDAVNTVIERAVLRYKDALMTAKPAYDDPTIPADFLQANSQYESGDFAKAADSYAAILRMNPDYIDARNNLGLSEMHLGNNISAIMQFDLILAVSPKYYGAEQNLSVALERIGLSSKAMEHAKSIVSANADLPMAQYNLGWFETKAQKFSDAAASFQTALNLEPNYTKALHASAINKMTSGTKPSSSELNVLSKDEKASFASLGPHPLTTWVFWVLMSAAIIILIIYIFRAMANSKDGGTLWGVLSTLGIIIAVIVFAVFYKTNATFSTVLWFFVVFDILVMNSSSA